MLRFLAKYLPRHTLNEMYKLYVRPHLDYGDVTYHIPHKICEFSHSFKLTNQMEQLEAVQYSAALAVTGAWKGTSLEKYMKSLAGSLSTSVYGVDVLFSFIRLSTI